MSYRVLRKRKARHFKKDQQMLLWSDKHGKCIPVTIEAVYKSGTHIEIHFYGVYSFISALSESEFIAVGQYLKRERISGR